MRTFGSLLAFTVCVAARVAAAQFTPRDTTALANAVAERIYTQYGTGITREPFAIAARAPDMPFAMRVSAALRTRDSSLIVLEPTRDIRRLHVGAISLIAGDTATVTLWLERCKGTPPVYTASDASLAFHRKGDQWTYAERNVGGKGLANSGCPWSPSRP